MSADTPTLFSASRTRRATSLMRKFWYTRLKICSLTAAGSGWIDGHPTAPHAAHDQLRQVLHSTAVSRKHEGFAAGEIGFYRKLDRLTNVAWMKPLPLESWVADQLEFPALVDLGDEIVDE